MQRTFGVVEWFAYRKFPVCPQRYQLKGSQVSNGRCRLVRADSTKPNVQYICVCDVRSVHGQSTGAWPAEGPSFIPPVPVSPLKVSKVERDAKGHILRPWPATGGLSQDEPVAGSFVALHTLAPKWKL